MSSHSRSARSRYAFDNFMSKGGLSIFLALLTLFGSAFVLMGALRVVAVAVSGDPAAGEIGDQLWRTFLQITDAGAVAEDGDSNWVDKAIGIVTVAVGLVLFSSLVAFITAQFEARLAELRKGRSTVVESGHTLVLGFNERAVEVIRELIVANASERRAAIVVLAETPKDEMDDQLADRIPERGTTRIVTRSGSPSSLPALRRMAVDRARSVLVLNAADGSADAEACSRADARVLKAVVAVLAATEGSTSPIVAELHDARRRALAVSLGASRVTTLAEREILAKLLVQTSRSSGLALVYADLVGFMGHEVYFFKPDGGWAGKAFGALHHHFRRSVPLGFRRADGSIVLNPDPGAAVPEDADAIVLAEDDSTIGYSKTPVSTSTVERIPDRRYAQTPERELLVGWSEKGERIVAEYARFLQPGSALDVLLPSGSPLVAASLEALRESFPDVTLTMLEGDAADPACIAKLQPERYANIILLADPADTAEEMDAGTIARLLVLRSYFRAHAQTAGAPAETQLISEVMDSDNAELVLRSGVKDFLISNQFVSKILAQVAQEPDVMRVYEDLFHPDGSEIYLKPAALYFDDLPREIVFADILGAAQLRKEVCFGVKIEAQAADPTAHHGVRLLPDRSERILLHAADSLVVLALDET